jgi:outer membrane lipoprotein-sorting protein
MDGIAGVAELGDARDLKSCGPLAYAGSTPAPGTNPLNWRGVVGTFARIGAIRLGFFLLACHVMLFPTAAWALSGLEIMQKQRELQRPKDEIQTMSVKLISKTGEVKQRRVVVYTLLDDQDLKKTLIRVLAPHDVENTGILIREKSDGNDDAWMYLPASKKVKPIASSRRSRRFMGTDFAEEDLRPEPLAFLNYSLVGSEELDGQECYVIEAVPATPAQAADTDYGKVKIWMRKDIYLSVKREFYDKNGTLAKFETRRKLVNVKGTFWRPYELEMQNVQAGTRTEVVIEKYALDTGLRESFFSEVELARGGP